jgi:hypothetical protein
MLEKNWLDYSDDEIADAIYQAEGGSKAKVPYGILSIKVEGDQEARRICLNTIRNNRVRFANQSIFTDYIEFLGSRYCPIGADNDPQGLNKNWVKNVKYFLTKKEE